MMENLKTFTSYETERENLNALVTKELTRISSGTPVNAVNASGIITVSDTPVADETMVIGETTYTFKAARMTLSSSYNSTV
jgi:hypothetical protein